MKQEKRTTSIDEAEWLLAFDQDMVRGLLGGGLFYNEVAEWSVKDEEFVRLRQYVLGGWLTKLQYTPRDNQKWWTQRHQL